MSASGKQSNKGGLSTLDLMSGSPAANRITRLMLRSSRMTYSQLCDAVDKLPADKRLARAELDEALAVLVDMQWLAVSEDKGEKVYAVVLKAKASSAEQLRSHDLPEIDVSKSESNTAVQQSGLRNTIRSFFGGKK